MVVFISSGIAFAGRRYTSSGSARISDQGQFTSPVGSGNGQDRKPTTFDMMIVPSAVWAAVTIDCVEPQRVSQFWSVLLDAPVRTIGLPGWFRIGPTATGGPVITFQPVPEAKAAKTRIHLDVWVEELDAVVIPVRDLGGHSTGETHLYDEGTVVVMSDVEGNEFCLVGPPRRK
jgi:predicted enzyme related to lactoylglutathione lyase